MSTPDVDRLCEYRALGALAGITSAGVAFGAYFMGEIFKVTQQTGLFGINIVGGFLVLGIFASSIGAGGLVGRLIGEHIIYPIRTGNDTTAKKRMVGLIVVGLAVTVVPFLAAFL